MRTHRLPSLLFVVAVALSWATAAEASGLQILTLSPNAATLTPEDLLTVSAVVSEGAVGGTLNDPATGLSYGAFVSPSHEQSYTLTLTWSQLNATRAISFGSEGGTRSFEARFYDSSGAQVTGSFTVALACGDAQHPQMSGYAACSGACVDLRNDYGNCGQCGNSCATRFPTVPSPLSTASYGVSCNRSACTLGIATYDAMTNLRGTSGQTTCNDICQGYGGSCFEAAWNQTVTGMGSLTCTTPYENTENDIGVYMACWCR